LGWPASVWGKKPTDEEKKKDPIQILHNNSPEAARVGGVKKIINDEEHKNGELEHAKMYDEEEVRWTSACLRKGEPYYIHRHDRREGTGEKKALLLFNPKTKGPIPTTLVESKSIRQRLFRRTWERKVGNRLGLFGIRGGKKKEPSLQMVEGGGLPYLAERGKKVKPKNANPVAFQA